MDPVQPLLPLDWLDVPRTHASNATVTSEGNAAEPTFAFVDLFAGIGGFHAVLSALGGSCVLASEIDPLARAVYSRNWSVRPAGDIIELTQDRMHVPPHDVLAAGFPCQPFSKSGYQRGMDETRGTLFWNIARVLEERRPTVVLLENVRNLAGPRHRETTWRVIIRTLRNLGYKVSSEPTVFSPHLLPPELGGRPQFRERVFITGTYVGRDRAWSEASDSVVLANGPVANWDPQAWRVEEHLPLENDEDIAGIDRYLLNESEIHWISMWDDLLAAVRIASRASRLPRFPLWADAFLASPDIPDSTPNWKAGILRKNSAFYRGHRDVIDDWRIRYRDLQGVPASRRKLEWQAQDAASLWDTVMHFRPSGIRAKRPTYLPALVAVTQTSIVGRRRRRIAPREAARLQGLPDWFDFGAQADAASYKQLGNGVNVGAAYYVMRSHVLRDRDDIARRAPKLIDAVRAAPVSPDPVLRRAHARMPPQVVSSLSRAGG